MAIKANNDNHSFAFGEHMLRGLMIEGEPWFSAPDACRCLGLLAHPHKGTYSHHLSKLAADERKLLTRATSPMFFMGVNGSAMTVVSRPGLFKLIQRSTKPEAKQFDRWVRHEVLPQIMDNGGYVMKDVDAEAVVGAMDHNKARSDLELMRQALSAMEAMRGLIEQQSAKIAEDALISGYLCKT
ncbi:BRO family protein [Caenibius sp. WL]|uniref:BRO-N domain-containing protein n=1 Tax=Caenibius sp. WL TaxID=2872646 RepID=UPI001C998FCB|nr:BRO family protein [Caenibius sp. WL]QZP08174.1 hypothetical protein K5X80_16330 [Caenibius sp. WL]